MDAPGVAPRYIDGQASAVRFRQGHARNGRWQTRRRNGRSGGGHRRAGCGYGRWRASAVAAAATLDIRFGAVHHAITAARQQALAPRAHAASAIAGAVFLPSGSKITDPNRSIDCN